MTLTGSVSGAVESLWRYPVKSMRGEELRSSEVTERGLMGDRAFALIDAEDAKVVTAKNPRKWPELFEYAAAFARSPHGGAMLPPILVTLPDGTAVTSEQADVDTVLSCALHRQVHLQAAQQSTEQSSAQQSSAQRPEAVLAARAADPWVARSEEYWPDLEELDQRDVVTDFDLPQGTFYDAAVVHLLTSATLSRLSELYPEGQLAIRRFRPNIVVATPKSEHGFVENSWVGRTVTIGEQVQLMITDPCARCVMVTLPQGELPKDNGILRTIARHNKTNVGVYASVLRGGEVRRGDSVSVL